MEVSLSLASEKYELPKRKRQKKSVLVQSVCKGTKSDGSQCTSKHCENSEYCKRHQPKVETRSVETSTSQCTIYTKDSGTNTEGTMLDVVTANNVIMDLIVDRGKQERAITELLNVYNALKEQLEFLENI